MASWIEAKGTGTKVVRDIKPKLHASGITCTIVWRADPKAPNVASIQLRMEGRNWAIRRAASDFANLHKKIKSAIKGLVLPDFPSSSKSNKQGETQQQLLTRWMKAVLRTELPVMALDVVHSWCEVSRDILRETSTCRRSVLSPAVIRFKGWATKLGGNKEDPYDTNKGNWKRRYFVLTDQLLYFASDKAYHAGDAPKGVISLSPQVLLTVSGPRAITIHALPLPLIVKTERPVEEEPLVAALRIMLA